MQMNFFIWISEKKVHFLNENKEYLKSESIVIDL